MTVTDPQLTEKYMSGSKYRQFRDNDPDDDVDDDGDDNGQVDNDDDNEVVRRIIRNVNKVQSCFKCSTRVATTAVITGAVYSATTGRANRGKFTSMPDTIDGVSLAANDRVLVKDEAGGAGADSNGIWQVKKLGTGSDGKWIRDRDFVNPNDARSSLVVFVEEGTVNADTGWELTTNGAITIGGVSGTGLTFEKFAGIDPLLADGSQALAADLNANSNKIINLAAPTTSTDAANKNYVDNTVSGVSWKGSARAGTTANITLSGAQTIDGVSVVAGERVLVKDQTAGAENGIYVVAAGAWTRSTDADDGTEILQAAIFVREGTVNADTAWVNATDGPITIDTTALTFVQFDGTAATGGGAQFVSNFGSPVSIGPVAAGGMVDTNITGFGERGTKVIRLKVTPSAAISSYAVDMFRGDTFVGTSYYRSAGINLGVTPFEDFEFTPPDDDVSGELHVRITNDDASLAATFDVEVEGTTIVP